MYPQRQRRRESLLENIETGERERKSLRKGIRKKKEGSVFKNRKRLELKRRTKVIKEELKAVELIKRNKIRNEKAKEKWLKKLDRRK